VDARLPRREHEVRVLVPYGRGDLVARAHQEGEVLAVRHAAEGTELTARVPPDLAAELTGVAGAPVAAGRNATD
jgi:GTP-binding protein HflX